MTTILMADDIAVIRDPIAAALRLNGFQTLVASNGKEALELVRNARPDLVLRDIAMPVMNGLEMLRAMQADASRGWPPVILLTATSDREHVLEAAKLGVRDYLLKSQFSLDQLLSRVARRLEAGGKQAPTKAAVGGAGARERCDGRRAQAARRRPQPRAMHPMRPARPVHPRRRRAKQIAAAAVKRWRWRSTPATTPTKHSRR